MSELLASTVHREHPFDAHRVQRNSSGEHETGTRLVPTRIRGKAALATVTRYPAAIDARTAVTASVTGPSWSTAKKRRLAASVACDHA